MPQVRLCTTDATLPAEGLGLGAAAFEVASARCCALSQCASSGVDPFPAQGPDYAAPWLSICALGARLWVAVTQARGSRVLWRATCSINTAWLSVASSVAALVVPSAYGVVGEVNWVAVSLAAVFTVIGGFLPLTATHRWLRVLTRRGFVEGTQVTVVHGRTARHLPALPECFFFSHLFFK